MDSKKLLISGYYGFNNSGDEAVLHSILQALSEEAEATGIRIEPVVLSADPEETTRLHQVEAVHRMNPLDILKAVRDCDGLISGGGSLLQDVTGAKTIPYYLAIIKLAQWLDKPTFIYAQGLGPVRRTYFAPMIRKVFSKCKYISVRDTASASYLHKIGIAKEQIDVVPDPVMGMRKLSINMPLPPQGKRIIGVSVRFWNEDRSELSRLAKALQIIRSKEHDIQIQFLPFHVPDDQSASWFIMEKMGIRKPEEPAVSYTNRHDISLEKSDNPLALFNKVGQCDVLVGMRLHSLIYAAAQRVPIVGISYDPKIDHFLRQINTKPFANTKQLNAAELADEVMRLLEDKDSWQLTHQWNIDQLKKKSQTPAQQICHYLRI